MDTATEQVITLKVRGDAAQQLQEMADEGDRTLTAQLARTIREAYARFQREAA